MNIKTLKIILGAEQLKLTLDKDTYQASSEHPLNLMVNAGGDTVRFNKIEAIHLPENLVDAGVCGLIKKNAYSILEIASIFAVERELPNTHKEKRRTGFA